VRKQNRRPVLAVVIVVQDYSALTHESASGGIGDRDFEISRKGLVASFPSLENIIESIEENALG